MAGLDDFIKMIKDSSNSISEFNNMKINGKSSFWDSEPIKLKVLPANETKVDDNIKEPEKEKALNVEEQRNEDIRQRKLDSDNMILNSASTRKDNMESYQSIFISSLTTESLVQGVIFSEILGKPKCKRRRARW